MRIIQSGVTRDGVTLHTLRHTFATLLLRSGAGLVMVQRLMGHSRLDTTALYLHADAGDLRRGGEKPAGGGAKPARYRHDRAGGEGAAIAGRLADETKGAEASQMPVPARSPCPHRDDRDAAARRVSPLR